MPLGINEAEKEEEAEELTITEAGFTKTFAPAAAAAEEALDAADAAGMDDMTSIALGKANELSSEMPGNSLAPEDDDETDAAAAAAVKKDEDMAVNNEAVEVADSPAALLVKAPMDAPAIDDAGVKACATCC